MRKEILFAIIAGVIIGAALAFGIWRVNSVLEPKDQNSTIPMEKEESNVQEAEFKIALIKPQNFDVISLSPTTFSGITKPNSWIAISAEEEDYILKAGADGTFEQEIKLAGGVNQLLMYAFDENGASNKQNLIVVFSTEFEEQEGSDE